MVEEKRVLFVFYVGYIFKDIFLRVLKFFFFEKSFHLRS